MNGEQTGRYRVLVQRKKENGGLIFIIFILMEVKFMVKNKECISVKFHLLVLGFKKYLLRVLDKRFKI